jgi:hypothetical protein
MRRLLPLGVVLLLAGCAAPPPEVKTDTPPPTVEGGLGSEHGNYAAVQGADMTNAEGDHCTVWNWDRPLSPGFVVRVRSASCPSHERPGRMVAVELDRTIIPLSASNLAAQTP